MFWIQLLALLTLLTQTCSGSDTPEIRAVGESVTFHSPDTDGGTVLWSFGNVPIVTVPFEDPPRPVFHQKKFESRFTVSERGRALSISQLRMEDAGTYSVTIGGKISTFTLLVYKELTEPTVTCESQNCSGGRCVVSLRCSVTDTGFGNVSYTWRARDWHWEQQSMVVALNKSSQEELEPLTCTARNAVSSRNVTVTTPGGLCSENSTHPPGPGTFSHSGAGVGIMAGLVVGVAVVILLVFLVFLCRSQGWRKFHLSQSNPTNTAATGDCTTVYAEVGPSQQRIPNGIKCKPAGGESSSTVYSLVKRPEQVGNAAVTGLELV